MDAVEQAERVALRASDRCVVLTLREAVAIRRLIRTSTFGVGVLALNSDGDIGRAWRVLNNQVDWLVNPDAAEASDER